MSYRRFDGLAELTWTVRVTCCICKQRTELVVREVDDPRILEWGGDHGCRYSAPLPVRHRWWSLLVEDFDDGPPGARRIEKPE